MNSFNHVSTKFMWTPVEMLNMYNANMKVSEQCRIVAFKGNQVLGMILRNITYKENSLIVPLYKAIVRPHV